MWPPRGKPKSDSREEEKPSKPKNSARKEKRRRSTGTPTPREGGKKEIELGRGEEEPGQKGVRGARKKLGHETLHKVRRGEEKDHRKARTLHSESPPAGKAQQVFLLQDEKKRLGGGGGGSGPQWIN